MVQLLAILYANQGHAPTLARVPPMIRVFTTFDCPHPSSGVSKRPFGILGGVDTDRPPNYKKNRHYSTRRKVKHQ